MALRMTEEEYAAFLRRNNSPLHPGITPRTPAPTTPPPKRSKYGNKRVEIDGKIFDSQHEATVYQELMMRVRAGELRTVLRQVPFDLPGNIRYFADFVTIDKDMRITVYDAKSEATRKNRVYINKKKQMKACWEIEIQEV
ncbi:MAG: DUF1064 domain-containing protein [Clostridia bacterium]|nr:DUF1064 domain-containing protein [Clostridia bacterium]